ncbi:hypothetical protein GA0115252_13383 [Streptomyces sp. DfronAA-171]|nr:hypothetical protein GA0115252_13383 [Streptomyces sp. DfronAA-171]
MACSCQCPASVLPAPPGASPGLTLPAPGAAVTPPDTTDQGSLRFRDHAGCAAGRLPAPVGPAAAVTSPSGPAPRSRTRAAVLASPSSRRRAHVAVQPPSMGSEVPVTEDACGPHSHSTAAATSSGSTSRLIALCSSRTLSSTSSSETPCRRACSAS